MFWISGPQRLHKDILVRWLSTGESHAGAPDQHTPSTHGMACASMGRNQSGLLSQAELYVRVTG